MGLSKNLSEANVKDEVGEGRNCLHNGCVTSPFPHPLQILIVHLGGPPRASIALGDFVNFF